MIPLPVSCNLHKTRYTSVPNIPTFHFVDFLQWRELYQTTGQKQQFFDVVAIEMEDGLHNNGMYEHDTHWDAKG